MGVCVNLTWPIFLYSNTNLVVGSDLSSEELFIWKAHAICTMHTEKSEGTGSVYMVATTLTNTLDVQAQ